MGYYHSSLYRRNCRYGNQLGAYYIVAARILHAAFTTLLIIVLSRRDTLAAASQSPPSGLGRNERVHCRRLNHACPTKDWKLGSAPYALSVYCSCRPPEPPQYCSLFLPLPGRNSWETSGFAPRFAPGTTAPGSTSGFHLALPHDSHVSTRTTSNLRGVRESAGLPARYIKRSKTSLETYWNGSTAKGFPKRFMAAGTQGFLQSFQYHEGETALTLQNVAQSPNG